ncbi:MAG: 16S rRNA (cytosine(1402)-N(4))-methyltransferase RsmH [Candidatus Poribacteria bacterium]|nr:16S rRNA (cytosine(1402)-N(4))-methyltransferase RsmH [Candidatus Poribacteria bacterium]
MSSVEEPQRKAETIHESVLVHEVVEQLQPTNNGRYFDGTVGLGGHAAAILRACSPDGRLLGVDLDLEALSLAKEKLGEFNDRFTLVHEDFVNLDVILKRHSLNDVDGVLFDLGVSSLQLDTSTRGFSFARSGPLDMRMNPNHPLSAEEVVNSSSEEKLADIFWNYGEERNARSVARRIVQSRRTQPVTTTLQLAAIIEDAIPPKARRSRIHNATRVFQALRIYVNDELKRLQLGLDCAVEALAPGGRICVISFHSLEDRIVKQQFQRLSCDCVCPPKLPICVCRHQASLHILTKRPITPRIDEIQKNPRSRSAKLRAAMKICES